MSSHEREHAVRVLAPVQAGDLDAMLTLLAELVVRLAHERTGQAMKTDMLQSSASEADIR